MLNSNLVPFKIFFGSKIISSLFFYFQLISALPPPLPQPSGGGGRESSLPEYLPMVPEFFQTWDLHMKTENCNVFHCRFLVMKAKKTQFWAHFWPFFTILRQTRFFLENLLLSFSFFFSRSPLWYANAITISGNLLHSQR